MSELNISTEKTVVEQGDTLPTEQTPTPTTETPKKKVGSQKSTKSQKETPTQKRAREQAEHEKMLEEKWANMRTDISSSSLPRGNVTASFNNLVSLISSGFVIVPGMNFDNAQATIDEQIAELSKKLQSGKLTLDETITTATEVSQLGAMRENAKNALIEQWALSFVFSPHFGNTSPTTISNSSDNRVKTNNSTNNNIPLIVPIMQQKNELLQWLKNQGKPQNLTPHIVSNRIINQETWANLGVSDYFTLNGYQLFGRDASGNYTYLGSLGTHNAPNSICTKYRQIVTGLDNPPNAGIHTSGYDNKWKWDGSISQRQEEFIAWAEKTAAKKDGK